jgi:hypothetical protein
MNTTANPSKAALAAAGIVEAHHTPSTEMILLGKREKHERTLETTFQ